MLMGLEAFRIRRLLLIVPLLLAVVLSGCKNDIGFINARWITEISLTTHKTNDQKQDELSENKVFTDATFIKKFAEAMNKKKKISGEIDWAPNYDVKLVYGDGLIEEYYIAIGKEGGQKQKVTIASATNSDRAYSIPVKNPDQLRELVFGVSGVEATKEAELAESKVTFLGRVTISHNELFSVADRKGSLDLELLEGQYFEDWITPSPFMGRSWSGRFALVLNDEQGNQLTTFPISDHFSEPLLFNDFFQIQFADYNGDGDPDFTIGQYGTSNGSFYKLFTLRNNNVIEELAIKPGSELFISGSDKYSTQLNKVDEHSFTKSYYNNAEGKDIQDLFRWDGTAFHKVDK